LSQKAATAEAGCAGSDTLEKTAAPRNMANRGGNVKLSTITAL